MLDGPPSHAWSAAELNIGIICASIPLTRPLLGKIFPKLLSGSRSGHAASPRHRVYGAGPPPRRNDDLHLNSSLELSTQVPKTGSEATSTQVATHETSETSKDGSESSRAGGSSVCVPVDQHSSVMREQQGA